MQPASWQTGVGNTTELLLELARDNGQLSKQEKFQSALVSRAMVAELSQFLAARRAIREI